MTTDTILTTNFFLLFHICTRHEEAECECKTSQIIKIFPIVVTEIIKYLYSSTMKLTVHALKFKIFSESYLK